jgi:hypothetical protein
MGLCRRSASATWQLGASPEARAPDLAVAFADRQIGAVLATIGGGDQLTALPLPAAGLFAAGPQAFIGYSDNTSLLNWLRNLRIAGYHGGSTMVHLGRPGACTRFPPVRCAALSDTGELRLHPVEAVSKDELDWNDPAPRMQGRPDAGE